MIPYVYLEQSTIEAMKSVFGCDKPFVVASTMNIAGHKGDRVYFSNGANTVIVPRLQGFSIGQVYYIALDNNVYEWKAGTEYDQPQVTDNAVVQAYRITPIR